MVAIPSFESPLILWMQLLLLVSACDGYVARIRPNVELTKRRLICQIKAMTFIQRRFEMNEWARDYVDTLTELAPESTQEKTTLHHLKLTYLSIALSRSMLHVIFQHQI